MAKPDAPRLVRLDLNNPVFQDNLFASEQNDRHSALETLDKLRRMSWSQVYADRGLKWEKISSVTPPPCIQAIYSLRLSQPRRATAYRDSDFIRFLTIAPDHDARYGRK